MSVKRTRRSAKNSEERIEHVASNLFAHYRIHAEIDLVRRWPQWERASSRIDVTPCLFETQNPHPFSILSFEKAGSITFNPAAQPEDTSFFLFVANFKCD